MEIIVSEKFFELMMFEKTLKEFGLKMEVKVTYEYDGYTDSVIFDDICEAIRCILLSVKYRCKINNFEKLYCYQIKNIIQIPISNVIKQVNLVIDIKSS